MHELIYLQSVWALLPRVILLSKQKLSVSESSESLPVVLSDLISAELQREALSGFRGAAQSQGCFRIWWVVLWFNNTGKNSLWMHRLPPASVTLELSRIPGAPLFFLSLSHHSHGMHLNPIYLSETGNHLMPSLPRSMCHTSHQGKVASMDIRFICSGVRYLIKAFLVQTTASGENRASPRCNSPTVTFSLW